MALTVSLKSRRKSRTSPKQTPAQQFLQFELAQHQFVLPIQDVLKVIPLTTIYGDPTGRGIGLVNYQGQEILVLDIEKFLFPQGQNPKKNPYHFLLILQGSEHTSQERVGLPILSPPSLTRINPEAITPLPKHYLDWGNIHGVSSLMIEANETESAPKFLIDISQIFSNLKFFSEDSGSF